MVDDFFADDLELYVCITHKQKVPCDKGENHLISNWKSDVKKIIDLIREKENG